MPSINLRLTEEEHAELEKWAKDGHRSLQKEIIFRLFTPRLATAARGMPREVVADAQPRDIPARTVISEPTGPTIQDRKNVDAEWLRRRSGGKK